MTKNKRFLTEGNVYYHYPNCDVFCEAPFRTCQFCGKGTLKAVVARKNSSNQQIEVEDKK